MTEKDYNPEQKMKKIAKMQKKIEKTSLPSQTPAKDKKKDSELITQDKPNESEQTKVDKKEKKKPIIKKPVVKKTYAIVNVKSLPISTKQSVAICKFVKKKKIESAIADLEKVIVKKKPVPMKGEIAHKKGKGISSGKYPKKASEHFIKLLKSLLANANVNDLENPIVVEAVANKASRPHARFGRWQRKRTHIKLVAKSKKQKEEKE